MIWVVRAVALPRMAQIVTPYILCTISFLQNAKTIIMYLVLWSYDMTNKVKEVRNVVYGRPLRVSLIVLDCIGCK